MTVVSQDVEMRCRCGEVRARVKGVSPGTTNRVVCYCADCQAFAHHLGRADLLDAHGGSDIVQVAPATIAFERGEDRIAAVRLSPKGIYRWYSTCCKTPLGNTVSASIPAVGIVARAFGSDGTAFGPPWGAIYGKSAVGEPPPGSTSPNLRLLARTIRRVLGWRLRGQAWPNPFFDRATRAPSHPVTVLTAAERDALRPLCGPIAKTVAGHGPA